MTDEEYAQAQHVIMLARGLLEGVDIGAFLQRIDLAEAVGPILDPTLYIRARDRLEAIKRVARAAAALKAVPLPIVEPDGAR